MAVDAFAYLCVELGIQGLVAGDGRAKVCEVFHHLQGVVADGDCWSAAVLAHDVCLL